MHRPGGTWREWGGILRLSACADSVAHTLHGRLLRHDVRPRARPPTQGFAGAAQRAWPPARSVLKMNTLIRPLSHFCVRRVLGCRPASRAGTTSARRSGLARRWGISPRYVTSSTCLGAPLTESPGRIRFTSGDTRGAQRGQHSRVPRSARARRDDGNSGAASGADRVNCSNAGLVLGERLAGDCQQCHALLYGLDSFGRGLRDHAEPDSKVGA